jgi:hypothetical protein
MLHPAALADDAHERLGLMRWHLQRSAPVEAERVTFPERGDQPSVPFLRVMYGGDGPYWVIWAPAEGQYVWMVSPRVPVPLGPDPRAAALAMAGMLGAPVVSPE